jgi:5-methylcytosine-specific restriction endonuclease McrA
VQPDRHPRLKGSWRKRVYADLVYRDGEKCAQCDIVAALQVYHKEALQFGGDNSLVNLWLLCIPCHKAKTSREQSERLKSLFAAHRQLKKASANG